MHYKILVVGDVEEQMAPFQQNNMGTCPPEYLQFCDFTEEVTEQYNTGSVEMVVMPDGEMVFSWDERFRRGENLWDRKIVVPSELERRQVAFSEIYPSAGAFGEDWHGYETDEEGLIGYIENPNARWDWYCIGGRWDDALTLKSGKLANSAAFGDVDWDATSPCYAVLVDGEWLERTAVHEDDDGSLFRSWIEGTDPERPVSVVDAHI